MESVQNKVGLMSLPREIRDQIYGYILNNVTYRANIYADVTEGATIRPIPGSWPVYTKAASPSKRLDSRFSILHCSSTLRAEAQRVLIKKGTAYLTLDPFCEGPSCQ